MENAYSNLTIHFPVTDIDLMMETENVIVEALRGYALRCGSGLGFGQRDLEFTVRSAPHVGLYKVLQGLADNIDGLTFNLEDC